MHKSEEIDLIALNERKERSFIDGSQMYGLGKNEAREILESLRDKTELIGLESYE